MPKPDIADYISRHAAPPTRGRLGPDLTPLHGAGTVDATARARLEREAFNTGLLAVLICWLPFATILTLVAGATRWAESHRSFGGHNGAFAAVFSAVALIAWILIFALA